VAASALRFLNEGDDLQATFDCIGRGESVSPPALPKAAGT